MKDMLNYFHSWSLTFTSILTKDKTKKCDEFNSKYMYELF